MMQAARLSGKPMTLPRRNRVTATAAVEWIGAQPRTRPKLSNDMSKRKKASHVGTSGSPAGSMPTVNSHRDEVARPASRRRRDEGRFKRPDCASMKTGRGGLRIGTWNVRTLNQLGKIENLVEEAKTLNTDILGIAESRYTGEGKVRLDGYSFIYSGGSEHQHGVGFLVKSEVEKSILG